MEGHKVGPYSYRIAFSFVLFPFAFLVVFPLFLFVLFVLFVFFFGNSSDESIGSSHAISGNSVR
jgi:hypothetical protein